MKGKLHQFQCSWLKLWLPKSKLCHQIVNKEKKTLQDSSRWRNESRGGGGGVFTPSMPVVARRSADPSRFHLTRRTAPLWWRSAASGASGASAADSGPPRRKTKTIPESLPAASRSPSSCASKTNSPTVTVFFLSGTRPPIQDSKKNSIAVTADERKIKLGTWMSLKETLEIN